MKEWTTIDKSTWGPGEWQNEPDKVQWIDEGTDLDCLMVRNRSGTWCGYVGVPKGHPAFEKDYNDLDVDAHGGLTFADHCHEPTQEQFESIGKHISDRLAEAAEFPEGDAARNVAELREQATMTFEQWAEHQMARRICHVPEPGRPEVYWFGFDCNHARDLAPGTEAYWRSQGEHRFLDRDGIYRNRRYVEDEVRNLARQLKALT